MQLATTE